MADTFIWFCSGEVGLSVSFSWWGIPSIKVWPICICQMWYLSKLIKFIFVEWWHTKQFIMRVTRWWPAENYMLFYQQWKLEKLKIFDSQSGVATPKPHFHGMTPKISCRHELPTAQCGVGTAEFSRMWQTCDLYQNIMYYLPFILFVGTASNRLWEAEWTQRHIRWIWCCILLPWDHKKGGRISCK